MTPAERLKEIESDLDAASEHPYEKIEWLIARVKQLEAALESISKNSCCAPCRQAGLVARKALEGDE